MKLGLLILIVASSLTAKEQPPLGQIRDPQEFENIRSFCVDTAELSPFDRRMVKDFIKTESKPKHLLTKLPWKLAADCQAGAADATAKVEFVPLNVLKVGGERKERPYSVKAVLEVMGTDSRDLLYSVESRAVMVSVGTAEANSEERSNPALEQRDALYHAFWCLVEDVQFVSASRH